MRRAEVGQMQHVRLESITASVNKTATGIISVPPGFHALCINTKGTMMARTTPQGRLVLIPPKSLTYLRPSRWIVQVAKGDHSSMVLSWPSPATSLLDHWLNQRAKDRTPRNIACKPINPHFTKAISRFDTAVAEQSDTMEPIVVSFIFEVVPVLMTGIDQVQLAATPSNLPETIHELSLAVRAKPNLPWPLRDAADRAGYSPFHFSRVFKSLVGYGFHEYVDRCRTECAVDLLCTTDSPVDVVAQTCGFGTTQGLRESVKEYLGLVPSELRSIADADGSAG